MLFSRRIIHSVMGVILLSLLLLAPVYAQTPAQVIINYPETTEGEEIFTLGLYFTITDSSGRVVPEAEVESAVVVLDDGGRYEAQVEQPSTPFYITLVLDASGSMAGAAETMRQAAIQAINDAPEEARFAVIRFNEKVEVLQEFTEDRNSAINAIGEVRPVNLSGTCLYDAAFTAVQLMGNAPQGRRAIIVFTDGRDETAQGNACSQHVFGDVIDLAVNPGSRVPLHTIGLSTSEQRINTAELRDMARSTGGLSAIGDQEALPALFEEIMNGLKSQWLAVIQAYPTAGEHTATLMVRLADGTSLQPAVTTFTVSRDYFIPTEVPPTPTPIRVSLQIESASFDLEQEKILLDVTARGEEIIEEYRFEFFDENGLSQGLFTVPSPIPKPVVLSSAELPDGRMHIVLRAVGRDGQFIEWLDRDEKPADRAEYEFTIVRPTPTPAPGTPTPEPVEVTINNIGYDQATDIISLDLTLVGQNKMGSLEIVLINSRTRQRSAVYTADPAETVEVSGEGLVPLEKYDVQVIAQSPTGENLVRSEEKEFTYTPLLTPTPTSSPTPSPTATPKPIKVEISSIALDESAQKIVIGIITEDEDRIDSFELQLRDSTSGFVIGDFIHEPPPYDTMSIPLGTIPGGEYTAILRAFDENGSLLIEADPVSFKLTPPPTPTQVPSATPTFTPTPTPTPGIIDRASDAVRDNPVLGIVVGLVALALLVVLFLLVRPRRRPKTGTDFLSAQTGFYHLPSAGAEAAPSPPEAAPKARGQETSLQLELPDDSDKTNIMPQSLLPPTTLTVTQSPDPARVGHSVLITHVPFRIGRSAGDKNDLAFDEDKSISRNHATISYENDYFYITDNNSGNGTRVDNERLAPGKPHMLLSGARVTFGTGTVVIFETEEGTLARFDPEKTDYYDPGGDR